MDPRIWTTFEHTYPKKIWITQSGTILWNHIVECSVWNHTIRIAKMKIRKKMELLI